MSCIDLPTPSDVFAFLLLLLAGFAMVTPPCLLTLLVPPLTNVSSWFILCRGRKRSVNDLGQNAVPWFNNRVLTCSYRPSADCINSFLLLSTTRRWRWLICCLCRMQMRSVWFIMTSTMLHLCWLMAAAYGAFLRLNLCQKSNIKGLLVNGHISEKNPKRLYIYPRQNTKHQSYPSHKSSCVEDKTKI